MKHFISNKKEFIKATYHVVLIAAVVVLLIISTPVHASKMDDRIESSARNSHVFKTYLNNDDIKIQSKHGMVLLTGFVSEESRKELAQETIACIPGVKGVDNRLEVKDASSMANSDAWIRDKVKITLFFHRSVSASATEVDVKDGIVTLKGSAADQTQKELTTVYAMDVGGVKDVKNFMTVSHDSTTTKTTGENDIDDASITAQVKLGLMYHRLTYPIHTKVVTHNGKVTLHGKAGSSDILDLATRIANDVNGVKSVDNRMTID
jgi:hyperosmotically inducible periplasmic protein